MSSARNEPIESGSSSSSKHLHVEDADRLSALPQEIQSQILSCLSTLDAAKVGLLSKIWRAAWYSLSKLFFDYSQFPETEDKQYEFFNFIDQTITYHDESDVKTLKVLHWPFLDCEVPIRSSWIIFAVMHKVEKLILYGEIDEIKLPDCLFTCNSLVELELAIPDFVLPPSKTLVLPNLRILKLKFLVLAELTLGDELFSDLPSLEKLSIFFCYLGPWRNIYISSMKLEEFIMCCCPGMDRCSLEFRTPCLSNVVYISDAPENSAIGVFGGRSQFVINGENLSVVTKSIDKLTLSLIEVAKELFRNTSLFLSHWLIEYLSMADDLPRQVNSDVFLNIIKLDIELWGVTDHISVFVLLVSRCPNLNELSVRFAGWRRQGGQLTEDSLVEYCNAGGFRKVTNVRIKEFGGEEAELMLVRFLLANMTELRLMRIITTGYIVRKDIRLIISEILEYEKASADADVIFD